MTRLPQIDAPALLLPSFILQDGVLRIYDFPQRDYRFKPVEVQVEGHSFLVYTMEDCDSRRAAGLILRMLCTACRVHLPLSAELQDESRKINEEGK